MDLLAQYSGSSGGGAAAGDDGEAEVGTTSSLKSSSAMISAPKDIAPRVNTACMTLVKDGDEQRVVNVADTQNLHGTYHTHALALAHAHSHTSVEKAELDRYLSPPTQISLIHAQAAFPSNPRFVLKATNEKTSLKTKKMQCLPDLAPATTTAHHHHDVKCHKTTDTCASDSPSRTGTTVHCGGWEEERQAVVFFC